MEVGKPFLALITPMSDGGASVAHPIAPGGPPPHVEHPIPPTVWPGPRPPGGNGGPPVHVEHPIPPTVWPTPPDSGEAPPDQKPPAGPIPLDMEWHTVWSAAFGWALVGVPQGPAPTPSNLGGRK